MKKLVELLTSSSLDIQTPALRTVGNLLKENDEQTQLLISYGVLTQFATLLHHPKNTIRKEVVWSISNITAGNKEQIQAVIDANLFPKLMEIISSQNGEESKKEAFWAFSYALDGGTCDQIQYLVELGVIMPFCDALTSFDPSTLCMLLYGLEAIFKNAAEKDNLDEITAIIEGCEGIDNLESLLEHSNKDVVDAALRVFEFLDEDSAAVLREMFD